MWGKNKHSPNRACKRPSFLGTSSGNHPPAAFSTGLMAAIVARNPAAAEVMASARTACRPGRRLRLSASNL
jgi:hypothetical protein